ncbi:MAG: glycosyltransferase [Verrucomicrobiota bacterium]
MSETFIRAHIDSLPHDVTYIYGYQNRCSWEDKPLRQIDPVASVPRPKWLDLLPRVLEFRLSRKWYPTQSDDDILERFLRKNQIEVVLAEYGTTASFITPICRKLGIPLVAHFHGIDASHYKVLNDFKEGYRALFDYASTIVAVSNAMKENLVAEGCAAEKIICNPCSPADHFFEISPNYESNTILAVGRQTAKKAPYLTLDAFRLAVERRPELRLCLIGDGELSEVSENLVKAWGLQDKVDLVGAAEPAQIQAKMRESFLFVQHSIRAKNGDSEGMPVAVMEASAAGLPVVSTKHAGIPEVIQNDMNGFVVEPGDTQSMAKHIVQLADDRGLCQKLGQEGRRLVAENFSMEKHIQRLDEALCSAAKR